MTDDLHDATKKLTNAQVERQETRSVSTGRYTKLNPCEGPCGKSAGVDYYSDSRCNRMGGAGLVLCKRCAAKVADVPDDQYRAWFAAAAAKKAARNERKAP